MNFSERISVGLFLFNVYFVSTLLTTLPAMTHTISLEKTSGRFVIRYEVGEERRVLDELAAMVEREELQFD